MMRGRDAVKAAMVEAAEAALGVVDGRMPFDSIAIRLGPNGGLVVWLCRDDKDLICANGDVGEVVLAPGAEFRIASIDGSVRVQVTS